VREINRFLAQQKKFWWLWSRGILIRGSTSRLEATVFIWRRALRIHGVRVLEPGAQIGTGLRPLIVTGDGGFQMTEWIAHAPRYKLNPIVVLLNNGGWGIFRPLQRQDSHFATPGVTRS
jgi:hypothetical protein